MFVLLYSDEATTRAKPTSRCLRSVHNSVQQAISINVNFSFSYFPATYVKYVYSNEMILGIHMYICTCSLIQLSTCQSCHAIV